MPAYLSCVWWNKPFVNQRAPDTVLVHIIAGLASGRRIGRSSIVHVRWLPHVKGDLPRDGARFGGAHGSFFASRRLNDIIGVITGVLTLTPFVKWRRSCAASRVVR